MRLLLQFGANRATVNFADLSPGPRSQDQGLLELSSRVYPSDIRDSLEDRSNSGPAAAVPSECNHPEEDAKQQVRNPTPCATLLHPAASYFTAVCGSSNSSKQVLQLLARLIVPEILSQAGGQNRFPCSKCGVSRSRYCCTCLLPIGPVHCHPVPLLAPFQVSIIQHRCILLFITILCFMFFSCCL